MKSVSGAARESDDIAPPLDWTNDTMPPTVEGVFSEVLRVVSNTDPEVLEEIPTAERSGEFAVYAPDLSADAIFLPPVPAAALKARPLGSLRTLIAESRQRFAQVANKQPELRALYQAEGEMERALQFCHELKIGLAIMAKYNLLKDSVRSPREAYMALDDCYQSQLAGNVDSQNPELSIAALDEIKIGMKMFASHMKVWPSEQGDAQFQLATLFRSTLIKRQQLETEIKAIQAPTMVDLVRLEKQLARLESQRKALGEITPEECLVVSLADIRPLNRQQQFTAGRVSTFILEHSYKSTIETQHDLAVLLRSDPAHEDFEKLYHILHKPIDHPSLTPEESALVEKMANELAYQSFQTPQKTLQLRVDACASFPKEMQSKLKGTLIEKTAEKLALLKKHANTWPMRRARIWNVVGHQILGSPLKAAVPLTSAEKEMLPMIEAEAQQVATAVQRTLVALAEDPEARKEIIATEVAGLTGDLRSKFYEVLGRTTMPVRSIRPSQISEVATVSMLPEVMPSPLLPTSDPVEVVSPISRWTKLTTTLTQFGKILVDKAQAVSQAISLPKLVKSHWSRWAMAAVALTVAVPREAANGDSSFNKYMASYSPTLDEESIGGEVLTLRHYQQHQLSRVLRTENGRPVEWLNFASSVTFPTPTIVKDTHSISNKKYDGANKLAADGACYADDQVFPTAKVTLATAQAERAAQATEKLFFYPYTVTMNHGPNNIIAAFDHYMSSEVFALAYPHYVPGPLDQTLLYEWTEGPRAHHVLHRVKKNDVLDFATSPSGDIFITQWMRGDHSMLPYAQPIRVRVYPIRQALGPYSRLARSPVQTPINLTQSRLCTTAICW